MSAAISYGRLHCLLTKVYASLVRQLILNVSDLCLKGSPRIIYACVKIVGGGEALREEVAKVIVYN